MSADVAAALALTLFAVFGAAGFGWRTWLQHRRTGSTGFRGLRGRSGPAEWVAGPGFVIAPVVAVVGPILQLSGIVSPVRILCASWIQLAGVVVAVLGILTTIRAQVDMGDSWRVGVDDSETTALVCTGVFGLVRNPIYTAMLAFTVGIALLTPNLVAILGLVLALATVELQVRRVEEPYLLGKHGDTYRAYLAGAGRFIPGVGLIRES